MLTIKGLHAKSKSLFANVFSFYLSLYPFRKYTKEPYIIYETQNLDFLDPFFHHVITRRYNKNETTPHPLEMRYVIYRMTLLE